MRRFTIGMEVKGGRAGGAAARTHTHLMMCRFTVCVSVDEPRGVMFAAMVQGAALKSQIRRKEKTPSCEPPNKYTHKKREDMKEGRKPYIGNDTFHCFFFYSYFFSFYPLCCSGKKTWKLPPPTWRRCVFSGRSPVFV